MQIFNQNLTAYRGRYTFSGKERDKETGYDYFGFRYYLSTFSIWNRVDPLSDKYPSISSYAYCANNPVMLVDPDGRKIAPASIKNWRRLTKTLNTLIYNLKNLPQGLEIPDVDKRINILETIKQQICRLETSKRIYALNPNYLSDNEEPSNNGLITFDPETDITTLHYNKNSWGKGLDAFIHEGTHAVQIEDGKIKTNLDGNTIALEVEAYKNQWAADPTINSYENITPDWVRNIEENGVKIYQHLPDE